MRCLYGSCSRGGIGSMQVRFLPGAQTINDGSYED